MQICNTFYTTGALVGDAVKVSLLPGEARCFDPLTDVGDVPLYTQNSVLRVMTPKATRTSIYDPVVEKKGSTWPIYTPLLKLKNSLRSDVTTPVSPMVTPPIAIYKTPMLMQLLPLYDLSCEFETFGLFLCRQPLKLQINMFLYLQEQITMLRTMHRNCDACEFRSVIPLM